MKRYLCIGLVILSYLFLTACGPKNAPFFNKDLTQERWMGSVETNPNKWLRGTDQWFLTGNPGATELANLHAPYAAAITTMSVRVSDFNSIRSNGDFQVQLYGTYGPNSVVIYGPIDAVQQTRVVLRGGTLCIDQVKHASRNMGRVIVRIGVNRLNGLTQFGRGCIEGIQLRDAPLRINAYGAGNIYLSGNVNLRRVVSANTGSVNVWGVNTSLLDIITLHRGSVHVIGGHVGVRSIIHHGSNNIAVLGANSGGLKIYADGAGKVSVKGMVNVCSVIAKNNTRVYVDSAASGSLKVIAANNANVGMAGTVDNLYVETYQSACFEGRYLCARNAYARARDGSHINVRATEKAFAAATQNATIYFFGPDSILTEYAKSYGVIIPIIENVRMCPAPPVYPFPYLVKKQITYRRVSPRMAGEG